jgi:surface antigen
MQPKDFRHVAAVRPTRGGHSTSRTLQRYKHMKTTDNKYTDAAIALQAGDRAGAQTIACATAQASSRCLSLFASLAVLTLASAGKASAQSLDWDSSRNNPFVASGNSRECTAYAWGRFKVLNGDSLQFTATSGRHGGRFYELVVETPTVYRDSVPVRGSLASWTKPNDYGHVGVPERVNSDGSSYISEQNWPSGQGPNAKTLSAAEMVKRTSRLSNGTTATYNLAGYVCPNRPTSIGTLYTTRINSNLQLDVAVLDEDRRQVNVLVAIVDDRNNVVINTTGSGRITPNRAVQVNWNSLRLTRGKTYTVRMWTTDWRGLRSSKAKTFTW